MIHIDQPFGALNANGVQRIGLIDKDVKQRDIDTHITAGFDQVAAIGQPVTGIDDLSTRGFYFRYVRRKILGK